MLYEMKYLHSSSYNKYDMNTFVQHIFAEMQSALPSSLLRSIATAPTMSKVPAAALATSSARLEQAYRIEADSFGELKVKSFR